MEAFHIKVPAGVRIPILLSVPHCGTSFPDEIKSQFDQSIIGFPEDTDWFVDRLYAFAPSMGITMLTAEYSRWVIDLNRHPDRRPLYTDGRIITDLCPTTTFLGKSIYLDERQQVEKAEIRRRRHLYFDPYHNMLSKLLADLKAEFGQVLLWDCHSIKQHVPTIQSDKFPDLILGSADGSSAEQPLIEVALTTLNKGKYTVKHNHPFKGGFITRHFGRPIEKQHALQLEMTKINYMNDSETNYDATRAEKMGKLLITTLSNLADHLCRGKHY
jgi:N-formylglutamate deformylase